MLPLSCRPTASFLISISFISSPPILHRFRSVALFTFQRTQLHTSVEHRADEYPDQRLHHVLKQCIKAQTFEALRSLHALTITLAPFARQAIYFFNNIISLYVSFQKLQSAHQVFDKMPQRNGVSYNALISAYSCNDQVDDALELFCDMWGCGFAQTQFTFGSILSCPGFDIRRGCIMHGLMLKNGLLSADSHGGTSLIGMYGRHESIDEAIQAFHDMPEKNLVTWNSIISLLGSHGFAQESLSLFRKLMRSDYCPSRSTFVGLLSGFTAQEALELGEQIHGLVVKNALSNDVWTLNALLDMYAKYIDLSLAEIMFKEAPLRDVVTYNTLIYALAKGKRPRRGLELLLSLLMEEIFPAEETYVGVINCCTNLRIPCFGEYVHAKVIRSSFQNDVYVGSALVDFYGKCDRWGSALSCFDAIYNKNVVSWNSLIVAFGSKSHTTSVHLFREMCRLSYGPNEFTFSAVLKSSSIFEGKQLHSLIIRTGYLKNEYVFTSLLTSYAKSGSLADALVIAATINKAHLVVSSNVIAATYSRAGQYYKSLQTLSTLGEPDSISWNILISTCSHNGHHSEAFELFKHMLEVQIYPDHYTVFSILSSCCSIRSLASGSSVHVLLIKTNLENADTFVRNILIDMYAKCGCVEDSLKIFKATKGKNLITWTTMISALGHHGYASQALELFKEMEVLRIKPDGVLFTAVISACRHGGLVKEGMELFSRMQIEYGIETNLDHYHGLVDLLARNGHLEMAEQVIGSMPFPPNALIWRTFLEGCKRWRATEILA